MIRPLALRALKLLKRDIWITNSWTGQRLRINSYHHKAYWYFGRAREREAMLLFSRLIHAADTVIEIGGHIGFITQYFSKLVGPKGRVVVFEPGSNNLPYIEQNVRDLQNTVLERMAVSSTEGKASFFEDNVTGQNNSLLGDYRGAAEVARSHGERLVRTIREVDVVTLDMYAAKRGIFPNFLKIDIEGCELDALLGARQTLRRARALMVEVTEQHGRVAEVLREAGFDLFDDHGHRLDTVSSSGNIFALRRGELVAM